MKLTNNTPFPTFRITKTQSVGLPFKITRMQLGMKHVDALYKNLHLIRTNNLFTLSV